MNDIHKVENNKYLFLPQIQNEKLKECFNKLQNKMIKRRTKKPGKTDYIMCIKCSIHFKDEDLIQPIWWIKGSSKVCYKCFKKIKIKKNYFEKVFNYEIKFQAENLNSYLQGIFLLKKYEKERLYENKNQVWFGKYNREAYNNISEKDKKIIYRLGWYKDQEQKTWTLNIIKKR
jgi:hypothetical protein